MSRIEIKNLQIRQEEPDKLNIQFEVFNGNDSYLPATSLSGIPIRFSYRFFTAHHSEPWIARIALPEDVPANEALSVAFTIDYESDLEEQKLEISLVQDGVAWFHDLDMKTFSGAVIFPNL